VERRPLTRAVAQFLKNGQGLLELLHRLS
jgi:hypothetical protein